MSGLVQIDYAHGNTALTGWLARPPGKPRGGVVIFPTIANVNDHMRRRAAMLAQAGFTAMIADFYGVSVESFEAAGALAADLRADTGHYRARLSAAIAALRGHEGARGLPLAVIGYCMGGQAALEAARHGEDLVLAASFHGILTTGRPAANPIKPRLAIFHGDADPLAPREDVLALWQEFDAVAAKWHFHAYSGVRHGFTDPDSDSRGMPAIAYNASADRQSWSALLSLFDEAFALTIGSLTTCSL